jgi:hypothetical protein
VRESRVEMEKDDSGKEVVYIVQESCSSIVESGTRICCRWSVSSFLRGRRFCDRGLLANSCAPGRGGGKNDELGDGKGEEESGLSITRERRCVSFERKRNGMRRCGIIAALTSG